MQDFNVADIEMALSLVKNGKAAGVDGILPEFIKHIEPKGKLWLTNLFSYVKNTSTLPKVWHEAKVVAILNLVNQETIQKTIGLSPCCPLCISYLKGSSWRGYK